MKLGIISDTHNLLRPEVMSALADTEAILHAGDICSQSILDQIRNTAPVYAVRGNADGEWAKELPSVLDCNVAGLHILMAHKKKDLPKDLSGYDLVVTGHTHQYSETRIGKTLIINPGSCGPRRFHQKITMALAEIKNGQIVLSKIDIPHSASSQKIDPNDVRTQIEIVIREIDKGRGKSDISEKYGIDPAAAELIARLYLTHPGVTVDGIMTKMGL